MANIVTCTIEFGSTEDKKRVLDATRGNETEFDFEIILPSPSDLKGPDLRSWREENWGTSRYSIVDTAGSVDIILDAVWSAPVGVFKALIEKNPDIEFAISWVDEENTFGGSIYAPGDGTAKIIEFDCPDPYEELDEESFEDEDEYYFACEDFVGDFFRSPECDARIAENAKKLL